MIITQHNKCGNITNGFTQATVAKPLQHNNEVSYKPLQHINEVEEQ